MDMKPMEYHSPWAYISNKLSYFPKKQGVTRIHLPQGKHISCVNGTISKENITLGLF